MRQIRHFFNQYRPLLLNGDFLKVIAAGLISSIGSKISYFALLRKVYIVSGGQITDLGFLALVQMVPGMILGPFVGVLVDRVPRKRIMILCDIVNGLVIGSLIFVNDLSIIYVVAGISSLVTTFRYPAQGALEPNLVEKSEIVLLNSFKASSNGLIQVIGAAIGGATVGLLGVGKAFMVDAVTFFVSAAIIMTLMVRETHMYEEDPDDAADEAEGAIKKQWNAFKRGASVLAENVSVRMVFVINVFLNFAMAMQGMLIYYFLRETLQLGDRTEAFWGYLLSTLGVGGLVGSFILGVVIKRYENRFELFLNVLLFDAIIFTGFLVNRFLPLSLLLFGLLGLTAAANQIIMNSILQEEVEDRKRGRVFSLLGIIAGPVAAFSVFIGTTSAEYITARNVLLLAALAEALIAIGIRFTGSYRRAAQAARGAGGQGSTVSAAPAGTGTSLGLSVEDDG